MTLTSILMDAAQPSGGGWSGMLMILAMIVIFYFFMIRPQSKKQKEIKKAREAMAKGDKVVTAGGIYGKIHSINEAEGTINVEVAQGVVIKMSREQIFPVAEKAPAQDKK